MILDLMSRGRAGKSHQQIHLAGMSQQRLGSSTTVIFNLLQDHRKNSKFAICSKTSELDKSKLSRNFRLDRKLPRDHCSFSFSSSFSIPSRHSLLLSRTVMTLQMGN